MFSSLPQMSVMHVGHMAGSLTREHSLLLEEKCPRSADIRESLAAMLEVAGIV